MVKRSRAERAATAAARTGGSGVGAALSGFFSNPIVAILALVLGALLIFRGDITKGISGIKLPFADIEFPSFDFKFPEFKFPDITFPDFKFPDFSFDFPDFFGGEKPIEDISGEETTLNGAPLTFGEETTFDPNTGIIEGKPPMVDLGVSPSQLDPLGEISFNQLKSQVFNTLTQTVGLTSTEAFAALKDVSFQDGFGALDKILQSFNTPFTGIASTKPTMFEEKPVESSVISLLPTNQQFEIGGTNVSGLPIFGTI